MCHRFKILFINDLKKTYAHAHVHFRTIYVRLRTLISTPLGIP
jgi:hypothetical protein